MKRAELKNGVRDSTRSIVVNAVVDRCNMRFVGVGVLGWVIDLLVFQVLFALGANLELSQITSFFAGAMSNFALKARGGLSRSKHPSIVRGMLYCRFLLVALLVLLLRSAVLMLLVGNWHWQPQTAIVVAILLATAVFLVGPVFFLYFQS